MKSDYLPAKFQPPGIDKGWMVKFLKSHTKRNPLARNCGWSRRMSRAVAAAKLNAH